MRAHLLHEAPAWGRRGDTLVTRVSEGIASFAPSSPCLFAVSLVGRGGGRLDSTSRRSGGPGRHGARTFFPTFFPEVLTDATRRRSAGEPGKAARPPGCQIRRGCRSRSARCHRPVAERPPVAPEATGLPSTSSAALAPATTYPTRRRSASCMGATSQRDGRTTRCESRRARPPPSRRLAPSVRRARTSPSGVDIAVVEPPPPLHARWPGPAFSRTRSAPHPACSGTRSQEGVPTIVVPDGLGHLRGRGAYMITPTPARQMSAPVTS